MADKGIVYVDNNATTCVAAEVFEAMVPFLTNEYANPSSPHPFAAAPAVPSVADRTAYKQTSLKLRRERERARGANALCGLRRALSCGRSEGRFRS